MTSIHIRHVVPATLHPLKRLARSHHRSLQGELHAILERAAMLAPRVEAVRTLNLVTSRTGRKSSWSRDDVYGLDGR